jgi:hypothetical protein
MDTWGRQAVTKLQKTELINLLKIQSRKILPHNVVKLCAKSSLNYK